MDDQGINPAAFVEHNLSPAASDNLAPQYTPLTNPSSLFSVYHGSTSSFDPGTTQRASDLSIGAGMHPQVDPSSFFHTHHNTMSLFNPETQRGVNSCIGNVINPPISPSTLPPADPETQRRTDSNIGAVIDVFNPEPRPPVNLRVSL